jgi:hypothetical protein
MSTRKPTVRICADCQHCAIQRQMLIIRTEMCQHPRAVDLVTGMPVWPARQMRDPGSRLCGPGGRLWAAKTGSLVDQSSMRPLADPVDDVLAVVQPIAGSIRRARA